MAYELMIAGDDDCVLAVSGHIAKKGFALAIFQFYLISLANFDRPLCSYNVCDELAPFAMIVFGNH